MDPNECPNKAQHVSGFPGFDRVNCPICTMVYVRAPGVIPIEMVGANTDKGGS